MSGTAVPGVPLERLRARIDRLGELTGRDGLSHDRVALPAAKYGFIAAVAAAVDACRAVITGEALRSWSDAADAFRVLAEQGRLPPTLADELLDAVVLRDALVRDAVDDGEVVAALRSGAGSLRGFLQALADEEATGG